MSEIIPFLDQQTIFLNGSTGLVGKIVILKLLTHCPNAKLYVLVRGKKDLSARERFEKEVMRESLIYEEFLKKNPDAINNLTVVNGDIGEDRMGLSDEIYEELAENVTVFLHIAATTNFNENLEVAFNINVLGTRRAIEFGKACKKLISMIHVSTAYVNSIRVAGEDIKEKIYPLDFDYNQITDYVMNTDPKVLAKKTKKIIGDHPNTYTFSKSISEHIVQEEKGDLPVAIVRPSIITGAKVFPIVGWVDSLIGAAGLMLANGMGALHSLIGDRNIRPDLIPVDFVCNQILVACWNTAVNPPIKRIPLYHACCGKDQTVTWHKLRNINEGYFRRNPSRKGVGFPLLLLHRSSPTYYLSHYMLQLLPAAYMDTRRIIRGQKAKMVKASGHLYRIAMSMAFFISNQFAFSLKNTNALYDSLNDTDKEIFNFDMKNFDWELYLLQFVQGLRLYLLKEAYDNASIAHKL